MSSILGVRRARTLYNLADAILDEAQTHAADGSLRDLLPAVERRLRHQGLGAIRSTWMCLLVLDYWPILSGPTRRRFWRLSREDRKRSFQSLLGLPLLGTAAARLREGLAQASVETSADQSTEGA